MNKSNLNLITETNIGLIKKINDKNSIIKNKIFMPGDTDTFITLR